jgi:hypothetical protein
MCYKSDKKRESMYSWFFQILLHIFYNCGHTTIGGPVIVSNNNNAGVSGQELPPVLVIGKPPG